MSFLLRHLSFLVLGTIVLALLWPGPGSAIKPTVAPLLMIMMVLSSLKITPSRLGRLIVDSRRYLVITFLVFVLPAGIVWLLRSVVSPPVMLGLLVTAAAPAGISSVFLADLMGGEPNKALLATTLTHLVSPIMTPLMVWIVAHELIRVDPLAIGWLIIKLIIIPFIIAQIIRRTRWYRPLVRISAPGNLLLLLVIIWGVVGPATPALATAGLDLWRPLAVAAAIMAAEVTVSIWFGRTRKEDITWSIVDTYKNYVLASVIAATFFGPQAVLGVVAYSVVVNIVIAPLNWWATHR